MERSDHKVYVGTKRGKVKPTRTRVGHHDIARRPYRRARIGISAPGSRQRQVLQGCAAARPPQRSSSVAVQLPDKPWIVGRDVAATTELLHPLAVNLADVKVSRLVDVEPVNTPGAPRCYSPLPPRRDQPSVEVVAQELGGEAVRDPDVPVGLLHAHRVWRVDVGPFLTEVPVHIENLDPGVPAVDHEYAVPLGVED